MPTTVRMTNLFLQLGLDATPEGVARFISEHRLAPEVNVLDADFWSYGQIWCMGIRRFSCLIAPLLVRRLGI